MNLQTEKLVSPRVFYSDDPYTLSHRWAAKQKNVKPSQRLDLSGCNFTFASDRIEVSMTDGPSAVFIKRNISG